MMRGCYNSRVFWARGFIALWAVLGLGVMVRPAAAKPFVYVVSDASPPGIFDRLGALLSSEDPDFRHGYVSVIDTATNMVVATVPVGIRPNAVAVTPDGKYAYVTNGGLGVPSGNVSVIDTASNKVVATVTVGGYPLGVAVTPDEKRPYALELFATGIAVTPDGKHAYVTDPGCQLMMPSFLSVIDTASNTVVATIPEVMGCWATGMAVTPDGSHIYVTNKIHDSVLVFDTATNKVVATVPPGGDAIWGIHPTGIAVTPDGKHAYVATVWSDTISVIDTATNMVVGMPIPVGGWPHAVAVTPDGKHAYVANCDSGNVSVIDTAINTVVAVVPVGGNPMSVGIVPPPGLPSGAFKRQARDRIPRHSEP